MQIKNSIKELFSKSNLFSFGLVLILFALFHGKLVFWHDKGFKLIPKSSELIYFGALLVLIGKSLNYRFGFHGLIRPEIFIWGLILVFFSDWLDDTYNFFQGPAIKGELIVCFLLSYFLLTKKLQNFYYLFFIFVISLLFFSFFQISSGRLIFSDDHTAVFYRLNLLKEHFPNIPFYQPLWNAGIDARDFFSTGILNLYFLAYPLIQYFPLENTYNLIIALMIFVFLPFSTYLSARILGEEKKIGFLAITLVLCSSILWYRWALSYGSMGFVTSCCLLPLNFSLAIKICSESSIRLSEALFFIITFSLMLFWTPTILIFIPLIFYALFNIKEIISKKYLKTIIFSLLILNLPWIVLWLKVANVQKFISNENSTVIKRENREDISASNYLDQDSSVDRRKSKGQKKDLSLKITSKALKSFATNSNPLILFLAIPGLSLLFRKNSKKVFVSTIIWLLFLGLIIAPLKPQLELERMLLIMLILLCLPVALCLNYLFEEYLENNPQKLKKCFLAFPLSFMLCGLYSTSSIIHNRTLITYSFKDQVVDNLITAIEKNARENGGRVLFSGFVLHELEQGHLAPLTYFTKVPLIASSFLHNNWSYADVIPEYYLDNQQVEKYLDLMNAGTVLAHERNWKTYFGSKTKDYQLIIEIGRFKLFKRIGFKSNYFLEGSGKILDQNTNSVTLELNSPEAIIKFKYFPFLQADDCTLTPEELPGNIKFIKLSMCPSNKAITIKSIDGYKRIIN